MFDAPVNLRSEPERESRKSQMDRGRDFGGVVEYVGARRVWLGDRAGYDEKWLQGMIVKDASLLGLGPNLDVRDFERRQPGAGRLDLLLENVDSNTRYEVELQLGATDERHIVRTIEYWDIERRRYPNYEHVAVLVAEDITTRFLNVASLLNGAVPLAAVQLAAWEVGDALTLTSTVVLQPTSVGADDEDVAPGQRADRAQWVKQAGEPSMAIVEALFSRFIEPLDGQWKLNHMQRYIGLARNGIADNFILLRPRKDASVNVELRLPLSEGTSAQLDEANLDVLTYNTRHGRYKVKIRQSDLDDQGALLQELIRRAAGVDEI
jgi:hypothetical protein